MGPLTLVATRLRQAAQSRGEVGAIGQLRSGQPLEGLHRISVSRDVTAFADPHGTDPRVRRDGHCIEHKASAAERFDDQPFFHSGGICLSVAGQSFTSQARRSGFSR